MEHIFSIMRSRLSELATASDCAGEWPEKSMEALTRAGAWEWVIPRQYGGQQLDPMSHLRAYEAVAAGCMSSLLILSNRDSACELIAGSPNDALKAELLPQLARNAAMTSIGVSQLTTSHQSGPPTLVAAPTPDGFCLSGFMPWVTSAAKCQWIVTGAATPDGMQVLAALPTGQSGLTIGKPFDLSVMKSTLTSEVRCENVVLPHHYILRGPAEKVLATRSGVKPALVAAAGLGLGEAMLRLMEAAGRSTKLEPLIASLRQRHTAMQTRMLEFAGNPPQASADKAKTELRIEVNAMLHRLSAGVLMACKGTGLQRSNDAQRLLREAMFYQVWAAPEDVRIGTLQQFA